MKIARYFSGIFLIFTLTSTHVQSHSEMQGITKPPNHLISFYCITPHLNQAYNVHFFRSEGGSSKDLTSALLKGGKESLLSLDKTTIFYLYAAQSQINALNPDSVNALYASSPAHSFMMSRAPSFALSLSLSVGLYLAYEDPYAICLIPLWMLGAELLPTVQRHVFPVGKKLLVSLWWLFFPASYNYNTDIQKQVESVNSQDSLSQATHCTVAVAGAGNQLSLPPETMNSIVKLLIKIVLTPYLRKYDGQLNPNIRADVDALEHFYDEFRGDFPLGALSDD